jgi:SP family general alpha glucoside:H+ symporter-like MFS transporter
MSRQPITSEAAAAAGTALDHSQLKDAARADHQEHSVSLKQAFLTHKKAIFWSMAMSAA